MEYPFLGGKPDHAIKKWAVKNFGKNAAVIDIISKYTTHKSTIFPTTLSLLSWLPKSQSTAYNVTVKLNEVFEDFI